MRKVMLLITRLLGLGFRLLARNRKERCLSGFGWNDLKNRDKNIYNFEISWN